MENVTITVIDEQALTWQQHNKIHAALNKAYSHRTDSFTKKSYALEQPIKRILIEKDEEIIGHTAIFDTSLTLGNEVMAIGGVGLTFSLRPFSRLGFILREQAIAECKTLNYPFAIGRVKLSPTTIKSLRPLVVDFLDIPLVGKTTMSHAWEVLAIYNTELLERELLNTLIKQFKKDAKIVIFSEIF